MYHGVINIYKEAGFTSHDVVAKLRGICKQKKIGHTGTLDPDAVGVLPVCLGSATGLCDMLTDKDKEYIAVLRLGITTDTQDASGTIMDSRKVEADEGEVRTAVLSFLGEYDQIPPMYSALKVNGKKLYELAREGKVIDRKPRRVTIKEIEILSCDLPEIKFRAVCSKGTYIRTLCHDIGEQLQCGGIMKSLVRTRSGEFGIDQSHTLSQIEKMTLENKLESHLIPVEKIFKNLSRIEVKESYEKLLLNGNKLMQSQVRGEGGFRDGDRVRVYNHREKFYGIYAYHKEDGCFKPVKMFFT